MTQALITGIATGSVYGLLALGMAITFYVCRVINFAQGQLAMIAVIVSYEAVHSGLPMGLAIVIGILGTTAAGVLTYVVAVHPVIARDRFSSAWLASTLGVALVLENAVSQFFGTNTRSYPPLLNNHVYKLGGSTVTLQQILSVVVAVAIAVAFEVVRRHSRIGKVGMAVAFDPEMASTLGINTYQTIVGAFAVAAVLAGVAGILIGPTSFADPFLGDDYGINGFIALMIVGTDFPPLAVPGGMILGFLISVATTYINPQASTWFPFVVVVVVLAVAPRGLSSLRWRNPLREGRWRTASISQGVDL